MICSFRGTLYSFSRVLHRDWCVFRYLYSMRLLFLFRVQVRFVVQVGPATGKFGYETYLRPKP